MNKTDTSQILKEKIKINVNHSLDDRVFDKSINKNLKTPINNTKSSQRSDLASLKSSKSYLTPNNKYNLNTLSIKELYSDKKRRDLSRNKRTLFNAKSYNKSKIIND